LAWVVLLSHDWLHRGGHGEAIQISLAKMVSEGCHCYVKLGFLAPVAAWEFKESSCANQVVANANYLGIGYGFASGCCKGYGFFKLVEERFD
jgi:hypothetical protein